MKYNHCQINNNICNKYNNCIKKIKDNSEYDENDQKHT